MGGRISVTGASAPGRPETGERFRRHSSPAHLRARPLAGSYAASLPALPRFRIASYPPCTSPRPAQPLTAASHTPPRNPRTAAPTRAPHVLTRMPHASVPRGRLFSPPVRSSSLHRSMTPRPGIGPQHARPVRLPFLSFPVVVSCSLRSSGARNAVQRRDRAESRRQGASCAVCRRFGKAQPADGGSFSVSGRGKTCRVCRKKALQKRTTTPRFPRQDVSFPRGAYPSSFCGGRAGCSCTPAGCRS